MMDVLAYCDGTNDLIDLSDRTQVPIRAAREIVKKLETAGVIERTDQT